MRPPPPDLSDPVQRAAYSRELAGVARKTRLLGIAIALAGAGMAYYTKIHDTKPNRLATILIVATGFGVLGFGLMRRKFHHVIRMLPPPE
ncbi:hypothetical protein [Sphingobium boeckii]|uniref:DUF202 domain-containing protein n=1 Tax=Sphingobium boeckii TaxID=1082345 RepID=A0A7W9AK91_9SPHN|nr:hypothetical protein [Sphingobium boeckii]